MKTFLAALLATTLATAAWAADAISVTDPFVKSMGGAAAGYFTVTNQGTEPDRLVSVSVDGARSADLHSSMTDASGMMQMLPMTEGIPLDPGASRSLAPGGDHLMIMGLPRMAQGEVVTLHLTFEKAGEITVEAPVDNGR